jgi:hypothetical protein
VSNAMGYKYDEMRLHCELACFSRSEISPGLPSRTGIAVKKNPTKTSIGMNDRFHQRKLITYQD